MLLRKYYIEKAKARAGALTHELVLFVIVAIICLYQIFCKRSKDVPGTTQNLFRFCLKCYLPSMNLKYWKTNKARARALCTFWPLSAFTKSRFQRSRDVPATGNYLFWGCYNCYLPSTGLKHWKTNKARARALCTFDLCTFGIDPSWNGMLPNRVSTSPPSDPLWELFFAEKRF